MGGGKKRNAITRIQSGKNRSSVKNCRRRFHDAIGRKNIGGKKAKGASGKMVERTYIRSDKILYMSGVKKQGDTQATRQGMDQQEKRADKGK